MSRLSTIKAAIAAAAVLGFSSAAMAADKPTIGVVVPTLDAQFWN
jgi:ABC-type sugar transport system substrate-binding protein